MTVCEVAAGAVRTQAPAGCSIHRVQSVGCWGLNTEAMIDFVVRGDRLRDVEAAAERLEAVARAAAAASGTHVTVQRFLPYGEMRHDPDLAALYEANARARGRVFPDLGPIVDQLGYSTDMGTISQRLPAIHPLIGVETAAINHQPEFTAACVTPAADRAIIDGAIALAWTAIEAATSPELRDRLLTPRVRAREASEW